MLAHVLSAAVTACLLLTTAVAEPLPLLNKVTDAHYACSTPKPYGSTCGSRGSVRKPDVLRVTRQTFNACRDACWGNRRCGSFSYDASYSRNTCTLYGCGVGDMGFKASGKGAPFWNRHCFACTTTSTGYPTKSTSTSTSTTTTEPGPTTTPTTTTTSTSTTATPSTTLPITTCTPNSFLLRARGGDPSIDGQYPQLQSNYANMEIFVSDPLGATVFYIDAATGRLAYYNPGTCQNPSFATLWGSDADNPYYHFWFEQQSYIDTYGDTPIPCATSLPGRPVTCRLGDDAVFVFCREPTAQYAALVAGSSDPILAGRNCAPLELVVVPLPFVQ